MLLKFSLNTNNLRKFGLNTAHNYLKCCVRNSSSTTGIKRFYKNVTISDADGNGYEINLDQRKLRTPHGTILKVPNEALAIAVANEWIMQKEYIKRHTQHITKLCNTAIENPTQRTPETMITGMLDYLETDTLLFQMTEPDSLWQLQKNEWNPIIQWICNRYNVHLTTTTGINMPTIPSETYSIFRQYLSSYDTWSLYGYAEAVESIKSFILATAVMDKHLEVEKAIALARLEVEFQVEKWGNVEWYHDIELMDLRARLASSALFVHLTSTDRSVKYKKLEIS